MWRRRRRRRRRWRCWWWRRRRQGSGGMHVHVGSRVRESRWWIRRDLVRFRCQPSVCHLGTCRYFCHIRHPRHRHLFRRNVAWRRQQHVPWLLLLFLSAPLFLHLLFNRRLYLPHHVLLHPLPQPCLPLRRALDTILGALRLVEELLGHVIHKRLRHIRWCIRWPKPTRERRQWLIHRCAAF